MIATRKKRLNGDNPVFGKFTPTFPGHPHHLP